MKNNSLVLVDGSYYLFRAYFATQRQGLKNSAGEHTGAILGVVNMLRKLLAELKPDYFAVVFDAKGKTFRNDLYPEYKAHRPPAPEEMVSQIDPIHEIIRAQGIPLLMIEGVEADDVIATLAIQAEDHGLKTTISTGDKDLAQIVNKNITLINTMSDQTLDPEGVVEKYGVRPDQIVDYLTLIGDSADNVPGVAKVGPKTAVKWLTEYGSLSEIIKHAEKIKGKVGENLRESLDRLPLSKELVTLKTDVELEMTPEDLQMNKMDIDTLRQHYKRWEFKQLLASLDGPQDDEDDEPESLSNVPAYETIYTDKELDAWLNRLMAAKLFAFDTETTSLDYMAAEIVGLSFSIEMDNAAYVPLSHDYPGAPEQLSRDHVLKKLKPVLESNKHKKVGQNLKYDRHILANYAINLNGIAHDTMLESYVIDSIATRHDMDSLALKYLDTTTTHYEDIAGKGAKQITFNQIPIEDAAPYAAEDADITYKLHRHLWPMLEKEPDLQRLYEEIEMPLVSVLSDMERNGVFVDAKMLNQQSAEISKQLITLEEKAYDLAGQPFNIGSPKQIQEILFEKMGLPVLAKTPKGQPSTAESVLQELAEDYELPELILSYRSLSKLKSTYTDRLPEQINKNTGRVHASFHQAVASTGRLSSSDPNLQNIPIRTREGRKIRKAFIASPGNIILAADYSQIELRIMAHLSGDKILLAAFENQEDVHRSTAAEVFNVKIDKVTDDQRRAAKAINFGLIYGMSAFGLGKQLGIGRNEASDYVERYFKRYTAVKDFMDNTKESAKDRGYVETIYHRRLYLPEINARNAARRQYAERTAINAPMQGTAADIIKRAMIMIDKELLKPGGEIKMIMQVHDELVFEVAKEKQESLGKNIRRLMESAGELDVPLLVDIGIGGSWDEAH